MPSITEGEPRITSRHGRTGATMITVALLLGLEVFFYLISESELNLKPERRRIPPTSFSHIFIIYTII